MYYLVCLESRLPNFNIDDILECEIESVGIQLCSLIIKLPDHSTTMKIEFVRDILIEGYYIFMLLDSNFKYVSKL